MIADLIGGIGGVLGIGSALRTYWLTRPKITLLQHLAWGRTDFHRLGNHLQLGVTILVANPRTVPNAIVKWSAEIELADGRKRIVEMPMGKLAGAGKEPSPYGTVPITVPPFSCVPVTLCLFDLPPDTRVPLDLRVIATDLRGRKHRGGKISANLERA